MRPINRNLALAALGMALGFAPRVLAFHDGGVASCESCHTMHNSLNGAKVTTSGTATQFNGNSWLLKGSDQSSTCLNCHAKAAGSTPGAVASGSFDILTYPLPATGTAPYYRSPGGDFAYLKKVYSSTAGAVGDRHGHNIVAADYGLTADATHLVAPGGTYSNQNLSCVSCHNPHNAARYVDSSNTPVYATLGSKTLPIATSGSYGAMPSATEATGVYRMLGGANYVPLSYTNGPMFTNDPPIAVAPKTYNRSEGTVDTRVAYGSGMSEWCQNCHTRIHNTNTADAAPFIHPAGNGAKLSTAVANISGTLTNNAAIYNAYKMSGDLTNTSATSYTSLVPFEEGVGVTRDVLATHAGNTVAGTGGLAVVTGGTASTAGPTLGTEQVMCLSCHRAHASGFDSMTRWNVGAEYITQAGAYPVGTSPAMTQGEYQAAMYDRPATNFATYQRSLCNKCHGKD